MNCSSCSSDNTQTIKMACLSGTTMSHSTAVGIDSHFNIGMAQIGTNSQTSLSALLNPGLKPRNERGMVLMSSGLLGALFLLPMGGIGVLIGFAVFLWGAYRFLDGTHATQVGTWEKKKQMFDSGWICHKCGHTWTT